MPMCLAARKTSSIKSYQIRNCGEAGKSDKKPHPRNLNQAPIAPHLWIYQDRRHGPGPGGFVIGWHGQSSEEMFPLLTSGKHSLKTVSLWLRLPQERLSGASLSQ